jgi:hypothetical protein
MDGLIQVMDRWSDEWLRLTWAVVWQSTLLVVLAALVTFLLRRSAPAARVWVWQIVAIKLLLMPFWTHAVILPGILELPGLDGRAASGPDDYIKTLLDVVSHRAGLAPLQAAISAGLEGQATASFKGASTRIESH